MRLVAQVVARPNSEPFDDLGAEEMQDVHDELSRSLQRSLISVLLVGSYCAVSVVSVSDKCLILCDEGVKLPFAGVAVSFWSFMAGAPLLFLAVVVFAHLNLGNLRRLDGVYKGRTLPYIFNVGTSSSRLLSEMVLYWAPPLVLLVFVWKAGHLFFGDYLAALASATLASLGILSIKRERHSVRGLIFRGVTVALATVYCAGVSLVFLSSSGLERLDGLKWRSSYLRAATFVYGIREALLPKRSMRLRRENLSHLEMNGISLEGADLRGARLVGSKLKYAYLSGARLAGADLSDSDLSYARLDGAEFGWFEGFTGTKFVGARLNGTDLTESVGLSDSQLNGACASVKPKMGNSKHELPPCEERG